METWNTNKLELIMNVIILTVFDEDISKLSKTCSHLSKVAMGNLNIHFIFK